MPIETDGPEHQQSRQLISSIDRGDVKKIDELRNDWQVIKEHIQTCPDCMELGNSLSDEQRSLLILWLCSPPAIPPLEWEKLSDLNFVIKERNARLVLVNSLWKDLVKLDNIIFRLNNSLGRMNIAGSRNWKEAAQLWFSKKFGNNPTLLEQTKDEYIRLDIIAGYSVFIDSLLVSQKCDLAEAKVSLTLEPYLSGSYNLPIFKVANQSVSISNISDYIAFRSGIKSEDAITFGTAISFLLPAYTDILPEIAIDVSDYGCSFKSIWKNPFSNLDWSI